MHALHTCVCGARSRYAPEVTWLISKTPNTNTHARTHTSKAALKPANFGMCAHTPDEMCAFFSILLCAQRRRRRHGVSVFALLQRLLTCVCGVCLRGLFVGLRTGARSLGSGGMEEVRWRTVATSHSVLHARGSRVRRRVLFAIVNE